MPILKGNRPRPRVALVGNFDEDIVKKLGMVFPTLRMGQDLGSIANQVGYQEIDLVIIGPNTKIKGDEILYFELLMNTHVINFSSDVNLLPGPSNNTRITINRKAPTEEFNIPNLSLKKYNLLESDLSKIENIKGWWLLDIEVKYRSADSLSDKEQMDILFKNALLYDPHTKQPFAIMFNRLESNLGVAWLPHNIFSVTSWIELICGEWSIIDPVRFPDFGDWTKHSDWMTNEELELKTELDRLNFELKQLTLEYKKRISDIENNLTHVSLLAKNGKRRLLTSQGNELLAEVAQSFKELGYSVTIIDDQLDDGVPKREDLHIEDPDVDGWMEGSCRSSWTYEKQRTNSRSK